MYSHNDAIADAQAISGAYEDIRSFLTTKSPIKKECREQLVPKVDMRLRNAEIRPIVLQKALEYLEQFPGNTKPLRDDADNRRRLHNEVLALHEMIEDGSYEINETVKAQVITYVEAFQSYESAVQQVQSILS